jgi:DNA-binding transcriptional regulator/RsmH inhibitor MraZ
MFLSSYENNIDKKGRVSVPASFRAYISNLGYNSVICFPSFNNQSIEAWPQDRIAKKRNKYLKNPKFLPNPIIGSIEMIVLKIRYIPSMIRLLLTVLKTNS